MFKIVITRNDIDKQYISRFDTEQECINWLQDHKNRTPCTFGLDYEAKISEVVEDIDEKIRKTVSNSLEYGKNLVIEFNVECIKEGVISDNMSKHVLSVTNSVVNALNSGALYLAIDEIKAITSENKDDKYITDERLLRYVNDIESYLKLPLSESL